MKFFRSALFLGILVSSIVAVSSYGGRDSPSDPFRGAAGVYSVKIKLKMSSSSDGIYETTSSETTGLLRLPYRKGRVTLRTSLGSVPIFIEGNISKVVSKKRSFGIRSILHLRGGGVVIAGPPSLIGVADSFTVSALSFKRRTFPRGILYFQGQNGSSLYVEYEVPNVNRAYFRANAAVDTLKGAHEGRNASSTGPVILRVNPD